MADNLNLSTYIFTAIFALFIIIGMTSYIIDLAEEFPDTELDEYITDKNTEYITSVYNEKNKTISLHNSSLSLDPDTDSSDIEGSFIVKGWRTGRNMISSTSQTVLTGIDLITDGFSVLRLNGWILAIIITLFFGGLTIIILKITIQRQGVDEK